MGCLPWILLKLLHTEADTSLLVVVLENNDRNCLSNGELLRWMIDASPRDIRNVEKTVDTTEVDERAVIGNVLDNSLHDDSLLKHLEGCCPKFITLT